MRNNTKKISLAILALTAVSLTSVAVGNLSVRGVAAETTLNTLDTFRVENVSIRLAASTEEINGGFRFESLISKASYDALTNVTEVGTLFVPAGFNVADTELALDANGNAIHAKVEKVVLEGGVENRRGGLLTTDENGADVISYRAYINDIPATAYGAVVTARSYVIADGVTYYTETVNESVGGIATKAYYDLQNEADEVYCNEVAEGWYSPFVEAQRAEIGAYVQTATKTYADQYVLVKDGNATLDLTKVAIDAGDVVGAMVDGNLTAWSVNGSTLTYATTVGEKTLSIATTKGVYNVALVQADQVITTYDQFKAWTDTKIANGGTLGTYKYTVLANDITASGRNYFNGGKLPANYVFNGLGHTIDKFDAGKGIVEYLDGGTTTWKNVNYTNYSGDMILYNALGGIFENINITGTVRNTANLLAYTTNRDNTLVRNCVFNLNNATAGTALKVASAGSCDTIYLEDTTIIYGNGQLNVPETLDLQMTNSYIYDIDDVQTNYYAKVSDGTATFALAQLGASAPTTVSKLLVNGTEVQATVANGNLTYPATNTGATSLMLTTDKGFRVMNIVHADNVITTYAEFNTWTNTKIADGGKFGTYKYTVLANDITATGTNWFNGGQFAKGLVFDGLGHTISNFTAGKGIVEGNLTGSVWKNVNYVNATFNGSNGIFYYLRGGVFENVNITGTITDGTAGLLGYGLNNSDSQFINCTFTITNANNVAKTLIGGEPHYYGITFVNTTINYSGTLSTKCGCSKCANAVEGKYTLTNSTLNSNYAG